MIRLLWLFLILDVVLTTISIVSSWFGSPIAHEHLRDAGFRVLIELSALAIIEAVRERKV